MAKLICKVEHRLTSFRVSIPLKIVRELGWESCMYVTVRTNSLGDVLIRRLSGDEERGNEGSQRTGGVDRSSGGAG
jgi:hypothetical protein